MSDCTPEMHVRLFADECVPSSWVVVVRELGYEIQTAGDAGRLGMGDEAQLEYATTENRSLLTLDGDMKAIHTRWLRSQKEHSGIILCSPNLQGLPVGIFNRHFSFTLAQLSRDQLRNQLVWLIEPLAV